LTVYTAGVLIVMLAAFVWTLYGLAQKQLLTVWNSLQVMMACAVVDPLGAAAAGLRVECVAGMAAEHPGGLWCVR
jgi:drug/metabolite transporter (DMT)-like permease